MRIGHSRTIATIEEALRICMRREHLRRTVRIALVVGVILTLINQADVVIRGDATAITWVKAAGNFLVPFIVSNLGLLAGKRAERDPDPRDRPPAPT
ncbi:MAG: nitrate/nitrite transporter NrtS [Microbacterium sp.]|uniref:nitrate/nitrite transporter NrtS n=1 Tax=Microbacterium sp. TaxID=51671 RepID=UPI003D6F71EA